VLASIEHRRIGGNVVLESRYGAGALRLATWTLFPSGWIRLEYQYEADGFQDFLGVSFDYPEDRVRGIRWLGDGPTRVWKNRLNGGRLGLWETPYNDTVTGQSWDYPEFKGYYAGIYWARLSTAEGVLTVILESDGLFLQLYSPRFPDDVRHAVAPFPKGDISFLHGIPAIGTKFHPADDLGPQGQKNNLSGRHRATVWMFLDTPG
jgi:hypothetical protein